MSEEDKDSPGKIAEQRRPDLALAWHCLPWLGTAGISILSRCAEARKAARGYPSLYIDHEANLAGDGTKPGIQKVAE